MSVETDPFATVHHVELSDFRNYAGTSVELSPGFNVLSGSNGEGKTNFLESLYLLATTRLLRGKRDSEAIRDGSDKARAHAELSGTGTTLGFVIEHGVRKRAFLNGLALPRAADLIGRLRCVCVSSADMSIVSGEPADRRLFLDLELSALSAGYLRHLALYKRATEQRNALLRDSRDHHQPAEAFEVWEDQIALHGAEIRTMRDQFIRDLSPFASSTHSKMGEGETLELGYLRQDEARDYDSFLAELSRSRQVDIARGSTSIGPHRDDVEIQIGSRSGRLFGSQGQQRTAVISIKMATLTMIRDREGRAPLLLLDDILSDLDTQRRLRLIDIVLDEAHQAVLTCTESSAAGEQILNLARLFNVRQGTIQEQ